VVTKTVKRQTLETYAAMVLHANAKREQYFNMTPKAIRADIWNAFGPDVSISSINKILRLAGVSVKKDRMSTIKNDRVGELASILLNVVDNIEREIGASGLVIASDDREVLVALKQRRKV
jgi:hypothetical protein